MAALGVRKMFIPNCMDHWHLCSRKTCDHQHISSLAHLCPPTRNRVSHRGDMSKQRQIFSKTNFPWKKNFFFGSEYAETHYIKSFFRKSEKKSNISTHFHETTSKRPVHTVYTTRIITRRFFISHPIFNFSAVLESSDPHDSENGSRVALRATEKVLSL